MSEVFTFRHSLGRFSNYSGAQTLKLRKNQKPPGLGTRPTKVPETLPAHCRPDPLTLQNILTALLLRPAVNIADEIPTVNSFGSLG